VSEPEVEIYTDGACAPNPGVGGWGAILIARRPKKGRRKLSGAEPRSTNNRMELTAAIEALRALKRPCRVRLTTDSNYLRQAFTDGWLKKWRRNGWRTSAKKAVLNEDLWRELIELNEKHKIEWRWVRGHANNPLNEECDRLAVGAREELERKMRKGEARDFGSQIGKERTQP
jgi:ribonuclease HI